MVRMLRRSQPTSTLFFSDARCCLTWHPPRAPDHTPARARASALAHDRHGEDDPRARPGPRFSHLAHDRHGENDRGGEPRELGADEAREAPVERRADERERVERPAVGRRAVQTLRGRGVGA